MICSKLPYAYLASILMLAFTVLQILKKLNYAKLVNSMHINCILFVCIPTLAARWYISGHAP
jgi:hypothetical protein